MVVVAAAPSAATAAPKVLLLSGQPASGGRALPLMVPGPRAAGSEASGTPQARKRQRLTHLSPEEKALRRKLKNRVAAQTARDRKKARMSELEQQVVDLEEENQKLQLENQLLREKTHGLVIENQELRARLGMDTLDSEEIPEAESKSDILLGILDKLDPVMFFKCPSPESANLEELPEVYPEGPSSLPTSLSLSVGTSSAKLEAINELIRFDHVYTKPLVLEIPSETESQTNVVVKIEEAPLSSSEEDHPEFIVSVKKEPLEDDFIPELGISNLLSSGHCLRAPSCLLDAHSDCGNEGSPSPFSDMSSPLGTDHSWEDTFANELFPQLISV